MAGYEGKIKNTGVQTVKAPFTSGASKQSTVRKGDDLRVKKGGK